MYWMTGAVEAGRQGHEMHFSRWATIHHMRGDVHELLSDLTGGDSVPPDERKAKCAAFTGGLWSHLNSLPSAFAAARPRRPIAGLVELVAS